MSTMPKFDTYRAANKVLFFEDNRSGILDDLISDAVAVPTTNIRMMRDRVVNSGNGLGYYIEFPTVTIPQRAVTVLCEVVRPTSGSTAIKLIDDGKTVFRFHSSQRISASNDGASTNAYSAVNAFPTSERHVMGFSRSGASPSLINLYLDGALTGTADQSGGDIAAGTETLKILRTGYGTELLWLVIIDEEMSAADIATLTAELRDKMKWRTDPGGHVFHDGVLLFDYQGKWGVLQSVAEEGSASVDTPISNAGWNGVAGTGRFKVIRTTGPGGEVCKAIKATVGGDLQCRLTPGAGTWAYNWYDDSAGSWKTQADAIHSANVFTLDTDDILLIADEIGDAYNINHTP